MVDISRIVSVVRIKNVRLLEGSCRSGARPSDIARKISLDPQWTTVVKGLMDDGRLFIEVRFRLEIRSDSEEGALQAAVHGTFELAYLVPGDSRFSDEELKAFADINAVFNAWPYWRELVQASLARMSLPVVTMPVFRLHPEAADEASASDHE